MHDLDVKLLSFINRDLGNPIFDHTLPYITDLHKSFIAVFLGLVACGVWIYYRRREAVFALVVGVVAVMLSDLIVSYTIKPYFKRPRPTYQLSWVELRTPVHYGYSFPSNHSTNAFAFATAVASAAPITTVPLFTVATLIAFSRVYTGVHFPLDVIAGSLFGSLVGWATWRLCRDRLQLRFRRRA